MSDPTYTPHTTTWTDKKRHVPNPEADMDDLQARIADDVQRACKAFPPPRCERERVGVGDGAMFLTPAEISVFRLVGLGLTNQELAERLSVDVTTICTHINRIHDKCDIRGRARLALVSCHIWHIKRESRADALYPHKR